MDKPPGVKDESGQVQQPTEPEKLEVLPGEEVQVDKIYKDKETIKASVYGVSFTLPDGIGARISQGADAFDMESTEKQTLGAIYMKREVTDAEVREALREAKDLGEGVVLQLDGGIEEKDGVLRASYGNGTYVGVAVARLGEHGNGVAFFLAAAKSDRAYIEGKLDALIKSTTIVAPRESRDEQAWKQLLSGHKLTYLKSSSSTGIGGSYSGSSRTIEITLRADGTFYYSYQSSFSVDAGEAGGHGGGYGNKADTDQGRWKVELAGTTIVLVLAGEKTERRYKLTFSDKKTYLDGTRYFRIPLE